ncbi:hypothetical protein QJ854_gp690 [Moumouvirus goulette]|uniref:Uncharacterized protein n=1 Tax=Moumouvirus goulette TaxID=1247379 RepID=M1PWG3_9VIRU|nr:hypothetical protein QJ854_gp690 [Moumouvirus goulette]AGF85092.1 hypothetical protein glt_00283 [Moumouvirus goulette]
MTSRYSYTNFSGNPYIHYNGVPYDINIDNRQRLLHNNNNNRTIIRSNQNTCPSIVQARNDPRLNAWSTNTRKDNLYTNYINKC